MREWQPIETAPKDDDGEASILASTTGKVWFQACWDHDDECWVTFNRYAEDGFGKREPGWRFMPKFWIPLPQPPAALPTMVAVQVGQDVVVFPEKEAEPCIVLVGRMLSEGLDDFTV